LQVSYQKALFELQLEDGFIKKPKHVADLSSNYFHIIYVVLDQTFVHISLIIANPTGMFHLKKNKGRSIFPNAINCQGQLQTLQSMPVSTISSLT
jgi:hypothetical protein